MKERDQEDWSVSDKFGVTTPCLDTYFLVVGTCFLLKVPTKASSRGKKL